MTGLVPLSGDLLAQIAPAEHDDRTGRGYPVPHPDNTLESDAVRVREAIDLIDQDVTDLEDRADAAASAIVALADRATDVEAGKADADLNNVPDATFKAKAAGAGVGSPLVRAPVVTAPSAGATGVSRVPTIMTSAFGSLYGVAHAGAQIQVATDSGFSGVVKDSGTLGAVTTWTVTGGALAENTAHHARARHLDADGVWSEWSPAVTFTTVETSIAAPTVTSPSNGATNIAKRPTFTSSAFAMTSGADTHAASRWQVSTVSTFATTVIDTGEDTTNKTSYTPGADLTGGAAYYVRVQHKGSLGEWSAWSSAVSFQTASHYPWLLRIGRQATGTTLAHEILNDVAVAADGSIYAVGNDRSHESSGAGVSAGYIIKANPDGTTAWERKFAHPTTPGTHWVEFHSVVLDSVGNVYALGGCNSGGNTNFLVVKWDASGNLLIHKWMNNMAGGQVIDAVFDGSGSIYFTFMGAGNEQGVMKIDTSLNFAWARYETSPTMALQGVMCDPVNGRVYVLGYRESNKAFAARFDSNGNFVRSVSITPPSGAANFTKPSSIPPWVRSASIISTRRRSPTPPS